MDDATPLLDREARSLVQRLRLWTPARHAAATGRLGTRGDLVHHLAQSLADRAAEVDGTAPRRLPRLDSDLGLADQLAVTADDLVRAGPAPALARAVTAHLLLHRIELLQDAVPPGLADALGLPDVLAAGRQECDRSRSTRSTAGSPPSAAQGPAEDGDAATGHRGEGGEG